MDKLVRNLYVDGISSDGTFQGDGDRAPFVVFDADLQYNIAGPFDTRSEADNHRLDILAGSPPVMDADKLIAMLPEDAL